MIRSTVLRTVPYTEGSLLGTVPLRCIGARSPHCAQSHLRSPFLQVIRYASWKGHGNSIQRQVDRLQNAHVGKIFEHGSITINRPAPDQLVHIAASVAEFSEQKVSQLNSWVWDRFRFKYPASDTATILSFQERDGGRLTNIRDDIVLDERRMQRINEAMSKTGRSFAFTKLTDLGICQTDALALTIFLLGKDRLNRSFGVATREAAAQLVDVSAYYFDVANRLGSVDAASYLIYIGTDQICKELRQLMEWPELPQNSANETITAAVQNNPENCDWKYFSAFLDLFYAQENLKTCRKDDLERIIKYLLYRIDEKKYELPPAATWLPKTELPHVHLWRILDYCLYERKPSIATVQYKGKQIDLDATRQSKLEELAGQYSDPKANFHLAIQNGDFSSSIFKQHIQIAGELENEYYGHAEWFTVLGQWQEAGLLRPKPGEGSLNSQSAVKSGPHTKFDTWYESYIDDKISHPVHQAISHAAYNSKSHDKAWLFERVMSFAAICQRCHGYQLAQRTIEYYVDAVEGSIHDRPRKLNDTLTALKAQLRDFDLERSKSGKLVGWNSQKVDQILDKYADPQKLIERYREFVR